MKIPKLLQLARDNASLSQRLRAETEGDEVSIYLHGVIGGWWGDISETDFSKALVAARGKVVHLRVDSPGGDVFAARSMMTAISQHDQKVIAHVDGLAASAATGICMACAETEISQGAGFMIHNSWTIALGNKGEMRKTADLLESIDVGLTNDYARRTGKTAAEIAAWMDEETWFTADQAKEHGFADRVVEVVAERGSNRWNLSAYANAPAALVKPPTSTDDEADIRQHRNMLERRLALLERTPA